MWGGREGRKHWASLRRPGLVGREPRGEGKVGKARGAETLGSLEADGPGWPRPEMEEDTIEIEEESQGEKNQKDACPVIVLDSSSEDEEFELMLSRGKIPKLQTNSSSEKKREKKREKHYDKATTSSGVTVKRKRPQVNPKKKKPTKDSGAATPGFSGTSGLVPTMSAPPSTSASTPDAPKSRRRKKTCRVSECFLAELSNPSSDYVKYFQLKKEELTAKLYQLYNSSIFREQLPEKINITWNKKLRTTAGYCHVSGKESGPQASRSIRIELSEKVCDSADRLRDTLIHELCHAATWLFHGVRDCHGPFWKVYAQRCALVHPELPMVKRCHNYEIHYKYTYECGNCSARIGRHSRSVATDRVACSLCNGHLRLLPPSQSVGPNAPRHAPPTASAQQPRQPSGKKGKAISKKNPDSDSPAEPRDA
ncbi:germ cell nuclear acidic protein isoform X3 [Monodelphis domestica]|uniref:germ cell nuclear acidic protein isoform X3 n=2 Tax=Monodelphis domestica TaxID=13616 RepID=UPI0024E23B8A|nr:germ cell nuclear acidic protein isoform X3 [Monodelphis domestica]